MSAVIDTNVFSFYFKDDSRWELYVPHLEGRFLFLSFMSLAELELWSLSGRWGTRRKSRLAKSLRRYAVQYSSPEMCRLWAETMDNGRRIGRPVGIADAWVAATAMFLDLPLITHNASDFRGIPNLVLITENTP
ncbi:MAG: PIN domain-containing protein [Pyrinomonadaceae bacterium]